MNTEEMFVQASRRKLRFPSSQGYISVEDLWDLPLTSTKTNQANLDAIAMKLDKEIKDTGVTRSFVTESTNANEELEIQFGIVIHIINIRKAENAAKILAAKNRESKEKIREILAKKKDESLSSKSEAELEEILASMG